VRSAQADKHGAHMFTVGSFCPVFAPPLREAFTSTVDGGARISALAHSPNVLARPRGGIQQHVQVSLRSGTRDVRSPLRAEPSGFRCRAQSVDGHELHPRFEGLRCASQTNKTNTPNHLDAESDPCCVSVMPVCSTLYVICSPPSHMLHCPSIRDRAT
jgi:hypothetical protein